MGSDSAVKSYLQAFDDFKKYIKDINSENSTKIQHYGYLIYLERYYEFKEKLKKNKKNSSFPNCYNDERIFKIKTLDTTDLMEQLNNDYKIIIINNALCQKICDLKKDTHQIEYRIFPEKIILYTENGKELHFKNNKNNIIDKSSLLINNPIINKTNNLEIDASKIYMDVINYYKMEKEISDKLNNQNIQEEKYKGFLVNITWLNKWKKYSFYDKIKNEFLLTKNNDKNKIINKIIEEQKTTGLNYDKINNIENYIIKDINQLDPEESSNQSFALVNQDFLYSYKA